MNKPEQETRITLDKQSTRDIANIGSRISTDLKLDPKQDLLLQVGKFFYERISINTLRKLGVVPQVPIRNTIRNLVNRTLSKQPIPQEDPNINYIRLGRAIFDAFNFDPSLGIENLEVLFLLTVDPSRLIHSTILSKTASHRDYINYYFYSKKMKSKHILIDFLDIKPANYSDISAEVLVRSIEEAANAFKANPNFDSYQTFIANLDNAISNFRARQNPLNPNVVYLSAWRS